MSDKIYKYYWADHPTLGPVIGNNKTPEETWVIAYKMWHNGDYKLFDSPDVLSSEELNLAKISPQESVEEILELGRIFNFL